MDMKKFSLKPLGDSCMKMLCKSCWLTYDFLSDGMFG